MYSKSELLSFINNATDSHFSLYNVDVSNPTALDARLTEVTLTGKASGGYDGSVLCQYGRTALEDIVINHSFTLQLGDTVTAVIPQLAALGWTVDADEFINTSVDAAALSAGKFTLTAHPHSYRFAGSLDLTIA